MCEICYTAEIKKFQDKDSWDAFDFGLSKKLVAEELKNLKNDGTICSDKSISIYECSHCEQIWLLKEPNSYYGGGHFVKG